MRIEALRRLARRYAAEGDGVSACARLGEAVQEARGSDLPGMACSLEGERLLLCGDAHAALGQLLAALRLLPDDQRTRHLLAEATRRLGEERMPRAGTAVHLCARVGTYRQFARRIPCASDVVVELGAAEGHTTLHLARRAAQVIAVEQAPESLARAQERCAACRNIRWLVANAFDTAVILAEVPRADLVFIDLGGSSWPTIALRAAAVYHYLYHPRAMVVRNVALNDFVASIASCEADAPRGHWREK